MQTSVFHDPHVTGPNYSCLISSFSYSPIHHFSCSLAILLFLVMLCYSLLLLCLTFMAQLAGVFKKQWNILHKFVLMLLYSVRKMKKKIKEIMNYVLSHSYLKVCNIYFAPMVSRIRMYPTACSLHLSLFASHLEDNNLI